jgi:hypothetical protein
MRTQREGERERRGMVYRWQRQKRGCHALSEVDAGSEEDSELADETKQPCLCPLGQGQIPFARRGSETSEQNDEREVIFLNIQPFRNLKHSGHKVTVRDAVPPQADIDRPLNVTAKGEHDADVAEPP